VFDWEYAVMWIARWRKFQTQTIEKFWQRSLKSADPTLGTAKCQHSEVRSRKHTLHKNLREKSENCSAAKEATQESLDICFSISVRELLPFWQQATASKVVGTNSF
jgi:hypothetical protein